MNFYKRNSNMHLLVFATSILISSCFAETIQDYICSRKFQGFKVDYKKRSCVEGVAVGCENPFPYDNLKECMNDFNGKSNICERMKPCKNNGVCSPIMTENHTRTYKCECSNTGFYGKRCHIRCPKDLSAKAPKTLPCLKI
ncbi:protein lin-12-like [Physella acuta]|uniref:protein lin-12-like n=1 Tax=Physella acuta TaxID=109671 RepID=UPI0027DDE5E7|nr:protein lin-12-like [Physella acuta]